MKGLFMATCAVFDLPVIFKTLMSIRNASKENASFLIIKSPNPSEMEP